MPQLIIDQAQIDAFVLQALGWAYQSRGRTPPRVDCYGLILVFYREHGIRLPDPEYDIETGDPFMEYLGSYAREIPFDQIALGDVLYFRSDIPAGHCGLYVGGGNFLHCNEHGIQVSPIRLFRHRLITVVRYEH